MSNAAPTGRNATAAAVRASVERGDPDVILRGYSRLADGAPWWANLTTRTPEPEPDPPQPVTANPQTLDTQPDRNYSHRVEHAQSVDGLSGGHKSCSTGSTPPAEFDREAWLARVQRCDP